MTQATSMTQDPIRAALQTVIDPHLNLDLVTAGVVAAIELEENSVRIRIKLGYPAAGYQNKLAELICQTVQPIVAGKQISADVSWKIHTHKVQKGLKGLMGVKNILAVASGKGGVGKSTVAANLALSLSLEGARVGILDADIYGPSQPHMFGSHEQPKVNDDKRMLPVLSHNIQTMSMGYLVEGKDTPMVWRGPMVSSALQQLTHETEWQNLDYLIVDLPPGTGDIQLTMAQKIPVSGAVIVTTPQDIALLDAQKALNMFRKLEVPVLGVIENMAAHVCAHCGEIDPIFGVEGGARMAKEYQTNFLGSLPLNRHIRERADGGHPIVSAEPDCEISALYRLIARRVAATLSREARDLGSAFSSIVIKSN